MGVSQDGKRTQITTVLDTDQHPGSEGKLALAMVQGSESFSIPYTIDLQMYADSTLNIQPKWLINTPATIRLRVENEDEKEGFTYQARKGIFQTFARQPRIHFREPGHRDLNLYIGRLVPAFFIMAQEVRYRVFENLSVLGIIQACMERFQGLDLSNYVNPDFYTAMHDKKDDLDQVKLEHAVQYGESTFNFLSRLMNRASIWYTFDHDSPGQFETMVLGKGPRTNAARCTKFLNYVDPRDLPKLQRRYSWLMLSGVTRTFTPAPKLQRVGEFNTVQPTSPLQSTDGATTIVSPDDGTNIINTRSGKEQAQPDPTHKEPRTSFMQESFPDLGAYDDGDTTQDAQTALEIAEAQVEVLSGFSSNASFLAGRRFSLIEGSDENLPDAEYLITQMSFAAYDRNNLYQVERNAALGLGALLNDIVIQPFTSFLDTIDNIPTPDITTALAAEGLATYLQDWNSYRLDVKHSFTHDDTTSQNYSTVVLGRVVTATANFVGGGVVPLIYTVLQDLVVLIEKIIDGVLKVIAGVLDAIAVAVLGIAAFVQWLMHKPTTLSKVLDGINSAERWIEDRIHPFFRPKYVDAYSATFNAVPIKRKGQREGAGIPLPVAQKTVINGPHLATVIGHGGLYPELGSGTRDGIYADKLGRVRIRFPWDRSPYGLEGGGGPEWNYDDHPEKPQYQYGEQTVWVRVSDAWAGGYGYGSQFLPRVGDEVVVSFVDGDPDRPVITGRLYNPGATGKSNLPFPVPGQVKARLGQNEDGSPEEDAVKSMKDLTNIATTHNDFTRSGIKTRSLQPVDQDTSTGFHMFRFDDKAGHEQLLLRSQRRLDVTSLAATYKSVGSDYHLTVGGYNAKTQEAGGDRIQHVFGNYTLHVGDSRATNDVGYRLEKVEKDYELEVQRDQRHRVDRNRILNVSGDSLLHVGAPGGTVSGNRYEKVEAKYDLHVVGNYQVQSDANIITQAGTISLSATEIILEAKTKISLKVGNSFIVLMTSGVHANGPMVTDNTAGNAESAITVNLYGGSLDVGMLTPIADPAAADPGTT